MNVISKFYEKLFRQNAEPCWVSPQCFRGWSSCFKLYNGVTSPVLILNLFMLVRYRFRIWVQSMKRGAYRIQGKRWKFFVANNSLWTVFWVLCFIWALRIWLTRGIVSMVSVALVRVVMSTVNVNVGTNDVLLCPCSKWQSNRHLPPAEYDIIKFHINQLLEVQAIQESSSLYVLPFVLVRKKDGSPHLCVDQCQQNSKTRKDAFDPIWCSLSFHYGFSQQIYLWEL